MFPRTRMTILALLFSHPERSYYLREVVRAAGTGQGAVQRELSRLAEGGIIVRSLHGRQVHFQANPDCPFFPEMRGLITKTAGLADVLRACLAPIRHRIEAAFVYGSQARGDAHGGSDVDLCVVGEVDELELHRALQRAEEQLGRPVNYTHLAPREFRTSRRRKGGFLHQILREPKVPILGELHED